MKKTVATWLIIVLGSCTGSSSRLLAQQPMNWPTELVIKNDFTSPIELDDHSNKRFFKILAPGESCVIQLDAEVIAQVGGFLMGITYHIPGFTIEYVAAFSQHVVHYQKVASIGVDHTTEMVEDINYDTHIQGFTLRRGDVAVRPQDEEELGQEEPNQRGIPHHIELVPLRDTDTPW